MSVPTSTAQYILSQDTDFQGRVLILTLKFCHGIMNEQDKYQDKVVAKALDVITNPESYKEKLALSVASFFRFEGDEVDDDATLIKYIFDMFDALSGVTP